MFDVSHYHIHCIALGVYDVLVVLQCRERHSSYMGRLQVSLGWKVNDTTFGPEERHIGQVPIMVKV